MASEDEERLTTKEYIPRKFIEEYTDPYPKYELVRAREDLIKEVCNWSERNGSFKLKRKLGLPEKVDTKHIMSLLKRDQGVSIGPPSYNFKSDLSFNQLDPNQRQLPSYASGASYQSHASSSATGAKRKSDNLVVCGLEKRSRQEPVGISGRATAGNLIVVNPEKKETEVRKRAISPMKAIEPGKSMLNITTVISTSSESLDQSIPKIPSSSTSSGFKSNVISVAGIGKDSSMRMRLRSSASASASSSSIGASSSSVAVGAKSSSPDTVLTSSLIHKTITDGRIKVRLSQAESICLVTDDSQKEQHKTVESVPLTSILKCDYCEHNVDVINKQEMYSHFMDRRHHSASIYEVKKTDTNVELVNVQKPLNCLYNTAQFQSYVVTCPDCREIFGNVFQCGLHYRLKHGQVSVSEKYALAPVSGIQVVEYTPWNMKMCHVCNNSFVSLKKLNQHEQKTGHFPFGNVHTVGNDKNLLLFRIFKDIVINNYYLMKSTIANFLETKKNIKLPIKMFVYTVSINQLSVKTLPPLGSNSTTLDIVNHDIETWKTIMKFHMRCVGRSRGEDNKVMAELEALRNNIIRK